MSTFACLPRLQTLKTRPGEVRYRSTSAAGDTESSLDRLAAWTEMRTATVQIRRVEGWDMRHEIAITQVVHAGRVFRFAQRVLCEVGEQDGYPAIRCPRLGVVVMARTEAELMPELAAEICFLWDTYAQAPDGTLSPEARALKASLLAAVAEVVEEGWR